MAESAHRKGGFVRPLAETDSMDMTSDLLSGPDLGAGYLHQLSIDREPESWFTYHAQVGGLDANGPPIGPLDSIGFVHPRVACQFGGSRCWHRRFALPATETATVRATYNRHRFVLQATLDQLYAGAPIPFESALKELLDRIESPLRSDGIPLYIMGSVSARLQGVRLQPRDIDLGTTEAGVRRIGELLKEYLIEPVALTGEAGTQAVIGARAFIGSLASGMRVEWAAPRGEDPESSLFAPEGPRLAENPPVEKVELEGGREIQVSRLEFSLVRSAKRNDWERFNRIADRLKALGPNRSLLERLLTDSGLSVSDRDRVRKAAADR